MSKVYCTVCRKETFYNVEKEKKEMLYQDKLYSYTEKVPKCERCGKSVHVETFEGNGRENFSFVVRKNLHLITMEQLQLILQRYEITQAELSEIANISLEKIHDYYKGIIPSRNDSNKLLGILDNPQYYKQLRGKIKGDVQENYRR